MNDPLNQLPTDPNWLRRVDELTEHAARELGCMVVVIVMQQDGKVAVMADGVPDAGPLHDMAQNVPLMLLHVATAAALQDNLAAKRPKQ